MSSAKVVFLYTELAGYFLACAETLSQKADVLIVRWPVNKEAPFQFNTSRVTIKNRSDYTDEQLIALVQSFKPDLLVCSGWIDKGYLAVSRSFKRKIPVILSLDNHWTGSLKQQIARLVSPFSLRRIFTHAWVPGDPQAKYARKLGFGKNVLLNYYCADANLFDSIYERTIAQKREKFPHRFLYVARYVEHKGIFELWKAFSEVADETKSDWELICIGTGDQWDKRMRHEQIHHIGFVQPTELEKYIQTSGVYILPSKFEPWGVTVQEFAIAGFPILVSSAVGARTRFLKDNGLTFQAGSVAELKQAMKKIMSSSDTELLTMAEKSHTIGMSLTPQDWTDQLLNLIQ